MNKKKQTDIQIRGEFGKWINTHYNHLWEISLYRIHPDYTAGHLTVKEEFVYDLANALEGSWNNEVDKLLKKYDITLKQNI